jgi:crossover junction endodeoxyribonuclease RuvC
VIFGIDPGQSGAATAMTFDGQIVDVFVFNDATPADIKEAFKEWQGYIDHGPHKVFIENVHTMPKQGIASAGKFMRHFGQLEGILVALEIPYELVTPQRWQKHLGLIGGKGVEKRDHKNALKGKAQQLWPDHDWTLSTADSALIAEYGRQVSK